MTIVHTDRTTWYKLDLSANVYPTLQRRNFSSVYRLSILLKEEIIPDLLQQAVDQTLPRFPSFKVALRKGLFWRYLEPNNRPGPFIEEDIINPCMPMDFKANHRYLIRIYYYQNRISLEVHHSLADGSGGMYLLQTITAVYLRLCGHDITCEGYVLDIDQYPDSSELEDAYVKYANSKVRPPRTQEKAYRVRGTKEKFYTLNIICGIMSTSQVLSAAKQKKASLTEYLNSVLLYALLEKQ
ncbi:MAG TPA: alcohol acetyltransferase, partial [Lachnospiraceae bacterium]|nr:alcohol acetyltransferase [Lachnospiraceae bacterium]